MTDINTINPHIVITELDDRETQMEELKHSLSVEGTIRDSRESDMENLKKDLHIVQDSREHQMAELRKHLTTDKTRICGIDAHVIGASNMDMNTIATISNHLVNEVSIKNLKVSRYDAKPSAYNDFSMYDTVANEECETLYEQPTKQCNLYMGDGVSSKEGTYGRRSYTISEDGVTIYCTLYTIGHCRMVSVNNVVMPLREFLEVRHMKVKENGETGLFEQSNTIVCDTDTHENTMMLPRKQVITFEIKGASVQTLGLAQIVLYKVLCEYDEKKVHNTVMKDINKLSNENENSCNKNYINVTSINI